MFVAFQLTSCAVWLGEPRILSKRLFVTNYIVMLLIGSSSWSTFYFLWVHVLDLTYPMPFIGLIGSTLAMVVTFMIIILEFPQIFRVTESFQKRKKYFMLVIFFTQIIFFTYFFLELAFAKIDPAYQWVLAVTLPFIREGLSQLFEWLCRESSGMKVTFIMLFKSKYIFCFRTFQVAFLQVIL